MTRGSFGPPSPRHWPVAPTSRSSALSIVVSRRSISAAARPRISSRSTCTCPASRDSKHSAPSAKASHAPRLRPRPAHSPGRRRPTTLPAACPPPRGQPLKPCLPFSPIRPQDLRHSTPLACWWSARSPARGPRSRCKRCRRGLSTSSTSPKGPIPWPTAGPSGGNCSKKSPSFVPPAGTPPPRHPGRTRPHRSLPFPSRPAPSLPVLSPPFRSLRQHSHPPGPRRSWRPTPPRVPPRCVPAGRATRPGPPTERRGSVRW